MSTSYDKQKFHLLSNYSVSRKKETKVSSI